MKKNFCRLSAWVVVGLLFVACGEETPEDVQPFVSAVGFDLATDTDADAGETRGSEQNTANLQNFLVFASYTGAADFSPTLSYPDFMYKQSVVRASSVWSYAPLKYWPKTVGHKVSFFAYAPGNAASACVFSSNTQTGIPTLAYTVPASVLNQPDLLVADPLYNLTFQSAPIRFTFRHRLCNIGFSAQLAAANPAGYALYVDRIELRGMYDRGTYVTSWTVDNSHTADYELTPAAGTLSSVPLSLSATPLTTSVGSLLLLPQQVPSGAVLSITLRIVKDAVATTQTIQKPLRDLLTEVQAGKKYQILFTAGIADCKFSYTVVPWKPKNINLPPFN